MRLGRLLLRLVVGGLFVGHGTQKLFGWFGGPGPEGTARAMAALDLHPPERHALVAGLTEAGGGALVVAGAATPLAAAALMGVMMTAIATVHGPKGPWNSDGGYEYNLTLLAALFALVDGGPGPWSVDGRRGRGETGPLTALAALGLAAGASAAVVSRARQAGPPAGVPAGPPVTAPEPTPVGI
jgi:putative oxidoreductase